jgi:queuine tRNA-ribosyltransferase
MSTPSDLVTNAPKASGERGQATRIESGPGARSVTGNGVPVFVPDATRGVIRGVSSQQLSSAGVDAILVSTAHLAVQPGASVVGALGGIHRFCDWSGPIISDSGGFQAFSLLQGTGLGQVTSKGFRYRFDAGQKYRTLTPESCIRSQMRLGSDLLYCLDLCTHPKAPREDQERSVELTVRWAAECRRTFDRLVKDLDPPHPQLFAVVQGGPFADLRARCAEQLAEIGFSGFGFGGYPVVDGQLVDEVHLLRELLPGAILHGLGIGSPSNLIAAVEIGYQIFDCVLPTRNGRRGVLYRVREGGDPRDGAAIVRLGDERWIRSNEPVDPTCDCEACTNYPAGYLAHLFRIDDRLSATLGSIHNLRYYARLMASLRITTGTDDRDG